MPKKLTTIEFIKKAKNIHENKYDYSLITYINNHTKIKIVCSKHGMFEQRPIEHLNGCGCPKCANKNITTKEFIEKAKLIHNNKYNYSLVKYVKSCIKVKIICEEHGVFEQKPNNHLNNQGCPKCANKYKPATKEFIQNAIKIHNNKYDYSLVDYINNNTKINIICEKHGIFKQTPNSHLNGRGCSKCKQSNGERIISKFLNDNNIEYIKEKTFINCKNKKYLPFDFYLFKKNILIEYDGEQHFRMIKHFNGMNGFHMRQKNDNIKTEFAKNNNIRLLRIAYNEKIEEKLIAIL
jgi:very-short-patch-repair endonuclease